LSQPLLNLRHAIAIAIAIGIGIGISSKPTPPVRMPPA